MEITFTIPGAPVGKERPRLCAGSNARVHTYTPQKTADYEAWVRAQWYKAGRKKFPPGTPLHAKIICYFEPPKSATKKARAGMLGQAYIYKPDSDNLAKAVLDSINGYAYDDDSRVCVLEVRKLYAEKARVEVTITEFISNEERV